MSQGEADTGWEEIRLQRSQEILDLMSQRNILSDEVKMVIHNAETTGSKLYVPDSDRFLSRKVIGNITYYVEYSPVEENVYVLHTTYYHKTVLLE